MNHRSMKRLNQELELIRRVQEIVRAEPTADRARYVEALDEAIAVKGRELAEEAEARRRRAAFRVLRGGGLTAAITTVGFGCRAALRQARTHAAATATTAAMLTAGATAATILVVEQPRTAAPPHAQPGQPAASATSQPTPPPAHSSPSQPPSAPSRTAPASLTPPGASAPGGPSTVLATHPGYPGRSGTPRDKAQLGQVGLVAGHTGGGHSAGHSPHPAPPRRKRPTPPPPGCTGLHIAGLCLEIRLPL